MRKYTKSVEDVRKFLEKTANLAATSDKTQINNRSWADGKVNKTRKYMSETGITGHDIRSVVRELKVDNYSATKDDTNPNFSGEQVWEFGVAKNLIDREEDLYIKLKIKKVEDEELLIMSFHPEEPIRPEDKLTFPYKDYRE